MKNQFYVYVYYNPETNEPFYVGKGSKRRYRKHLFETWNNTTNKLRYSKICSIRSNGNEPIIKFIESNLSEEDALKLEYQLIKEFGLIHNHTGILTNILEGGNQPPKGKGNPNWTTNNPSSITKGLSYEQRYGIEKATAIKQARSISLKGRKFSLDSINQMKTSAKLRNDREYLMKKVQTPDKIFNSCSDCANYYNVSRATITYRIKTKSDWNYV